MPRHQEQQCPKLSVSRYRCCCRSASGLSLGAGAAASPGDGDGDAPRRRRASSALIGSPGGGGDPDLAYLNITDEKESAEKEYMKQDSEHMAALEEAYARLREQNRTMEQQLKVRCRPGAQAGAAGCMRMRICMCCWVAWLAALQAAVFHACLLASPVSSLAPPNVAALQGMVGAASGVMEENQTIKGLLAMLQVRRDDFVFNPQQTIAAQQEAIGLRLLRNLDGSPPGAAPLQQQQQDAQQGQQPGAEPGSQQWQQQQQQGAALGLQHQHQQHEQAAAGAAAAAAAFDVSPGCLLPAVTPGGMRTVSPKIAAFRGDQQQPQTAGPTGGQQPLVAPPTVVPASPYDFPAEAQIAAAALTAKQGDTAAALLTLLDKAIEGRIERQQPAPQQAQQQPQDAQQRQQQAQQQQQRQQQMYTM